MKKTTPFALVFSFLFAVSGLHAQIIGNLKPDGLEFTEVIPSFLFTRYGYNQVILQNGFNSTQILDFSLSTGDDLFRSSLASNGLTVQDFASFPSSRFNADRRRMTFNTEGPGTSENWRLGVTDIGAADLQPGVSAFILQQELTENAVTTVKDVFYAQPRTGWVGFGGDPFEAQVETNRDFDNGSTGRSFSAKNSTAGAQEQDGILGWTFGSTSGPQVGGFLTVTGGGTGTKYGMLGQVFSASDNGTQYAVYGDIPNAGGTATKYAGYFNGNVTVLGVFNNPSDGKLKQQVKASAYGLETINKLRPVTYEYQREKFPYMSFPKGRQIGFLAEELESVLPELVKNNIHPVPAQKGPDDRTPRAPDGTLEYKGINYIGLIPVLTKAIQEQQSEIDVIRTDNEVLRAENADLKNQLDDLEAKLNALLDQKGSLPAGTYLQNYPNPFSHTTTIRYQLPQNARQAQVMITNMAGQVVRTFDVSGAAQGSIELSAGQLTEGMFNYTLTVDGKTVETRSMVVKR